MKNKIKILSSLVLSIMLSCSPPLADNPVQNNTKNSIDISSLPQPIIQGISKTEVRSGELITISGDNFNPNSGILNEVYFILKTGELLKGAILNLDKNKIDVIIPVIENQNSDFEITSIKVKVGVKENTKNINLLLKSIVFSTIQNQIKENVKNLINQDNKTASIDFANTINKVYSENEDTTEAKRIINVALSSSINSEQDLLNISKKINGLILEFDGNNFRIKASSKRRSLIFVNGMNTSFSNIEQTNNNRIFNKTYEKDLVQSEYLSKYNVVLDENGSKKIKELKLGSDIKEFGDFVGSIKVIQNIVSKNSKLKDVIVLGIYAQNEFNLINGTSNTDLQENDGLLCYGRDLDIEHYGKDKSTPANIKCDNNFVYTNKQLRNESGIVVLNLELLIKSELDSGSFPILVGHSQGNAFIQIALKRFRNYKDSKLSEVKSNVGYIGLGSIMRDHDIFDTVPNTFYITNDFDKSAEHYQYGDFRSEDYKPSDSREQWTKSHSDKWNFDSDYYKENHILEAYLKSSEPLNLFIKNLEDIYSKITKDSLNPIQNKPDVQQNNKNINPKVEVTPNSGIKGQNFNQGGTGFTPNGDINLFIKYPNGDIIPIRKKADSNGNLINNYNSSTATQFGEYQYYAVDMNTNNISNTLKFYINEQKLYPSSEENNIKPIIKEEIPIVNNPTPQYDYVPPIKQIEESMPVQINRSPQITEMNVSPLNATIKAGELQKVNLYANATDLDNDSLKYEWYSNNTFIRSGNSSNIDFAKGNHVIKLVVTDAQGLTASSEKTVVITESDPIKNYTYSFSYSNSTQVGNSYWSKPILRAVGGINGSTLSVIVYKIDQSPFSTNSNTYLKVGSQETYGVNHSQGNVNSGTNTFSLSVDLNTKTWDSNSKDYYVRVQDLSGGWSWVGPITVTRN